jgi:hypothetical protein
LQLIADARSIESKFGRGKSAQRNFDMVYIIAPKKVTHSHVLHNSKQRRKE